MVGQGASHKIGRLHDGRDLIKTFASKNGSLTANYAEEKDHIGRKSGPSCKEDYIGCPGTYDFCDKNPRVLVREHQGS